MVDEQDQFEVISFRLTVIDHAAGIISFKMG